jgi:hypothetical protein
MTSVRVIAAENTVNTTRATWGAAVLAERTMRTGNQQSLDALKQTLLAMFATQPDVLADFGLAPRKKAVISPQARVAAAAKAKATRAARGAKGSVQIQQVTGNVTGIIVTPVTTPAPVKQS